MSRPVTSKPRGICRYYDQPRGCFAGKKCKFLHGEAEQLTPYDKAKACVYYARGFCKRGDTCWFVHARTDAGQGDKFQDLCGICLEKPLTYGLLTSCNHVFCVECIRKWRDPIGKSEEVVSSAANKKCPLCRAESKLIIPSSQFFPVDSKEKAATIERYKQSMSNTPCQHFQRTKSSRPICPFGRDCFYQHLNDDGTPYIFQHGVEVCLHIYKARLRRAHRSGGDSAGRSRLNDTTPLDVASDLVNHIFSGTRLSERFWMNSLDELSATITAIRESLPSLMRRMVGESDVAQGGQSSTSDQPTNARGDLDDDDSSGPVASGSGNAEATSDNDVISSSAPSTETDSHCPDDPNEGSSRSHEVPATDGMEQFERMTDMMLAALARQVEHMTHDEHEEEQGPPRAAETYDALDGSSVESTSRSSSPFGEAFFNALRPPAAATPQTPSDSPRSRHLTPAAAVTFTSRFSTVVESRMIITVSEDEDEGEEGEEGEESEGEGEREEEWIHVQPHEEEEGEQAQRGQENGLSGCPSSSDEVGRGRFRRSETGLSCITDLQGVDDVSAINPEPPFVTDGRGRVVWSSPKSARSTSDA